MSDGIVVFLFILALVLCAIGLATISSWLGNRYKAPTLDEWKQEHRSRVRRRK